MGVLLLLLVCHSTKRSWLDPPFNPPCPTSSSNSGPINADISKMYREVRLSDMDKDLHRFLWRAATNLPVKDYRMTRVTFGVSASPYLAVKTLQQTAADHGEGYPRATHHIYSSFYVDDFLGGAATPQEAVELFTQLRNILLKGGFSLRKWRSSSSEVLQNIPQELQEVNPVKDATSPHSKTQSKALGLQWDSKNDTMSPSISIPSSYRTTKRGLISDVSRMYDILGWIAPAVLPMKLLYQKLWQTGHEWDEEVSPELLDLHRKWRSDLPALAQRQLTRCHILPGFILKKTELHGFSDASQAAFGAVVYCRTTYADHPPVVSLVTAKTKVAKLKPPTVPRLELCGAVLLTKILKNSASILQVPPEDWHAWSDSAIVLAWLDGRSKQLPIFVSNRVHFIMQETAPSMWHHVPTTSNPADCASRGVMPLELLHHPLWWEGPPWLKDDPFLMPKQPPRKPPPEERPANVLHQHPSTAEDIGNLPLNYPSIISTAAWCRRFYHRLKNGRPNPDSRTRRLTGAERMAAERWLLREAQARAFPSERTLLMKGKPLQRTSRLKSLHPLLDQDQLLRVGGRLSNSSLSRSQQHPIIADGRDPLILKLFTHLHVSLCHCGPSLLMCASGSRLHVLGARRLSRSPCSRCTICRKNCPKLQTQLMGELPSYRVTPTSPFSHTGMDFAGPITLKLGHTRRPVKIDAYVCIFICMTFKAVHLEVVSDLTTSAFKAALHRFTSRRNCPSHLYSDNGSNFIGARNELRQLYKFLKQQEADGDIQYYLSNNQNITWHTSPPRSPHFGGLWESAVKGMKKHLKRVVGSTLLTFKELTTIICQIEACMNSRPLLPITSHSQDGLTTLTASHFLLFKAPVSYPEDPRLPEKPHLLRKWNQCQSMVQHFWKRWSMEYLNCLQARTKWQTVQPTSSQKT